MARMAALLRAVNVGGRKLPMAELRALAVGLGWSDVATYIASGNLLFAAEGNPKKLEQKLEAAIERKFGIEVPVVVRTRKQLKACLDSNPFAEAAKDSPNRLILLLSKKAPAKGAEFALEERAAAGEQVKRAGDGLWILYSQGMARSKLSPALIDRLVGSPATGRNHRTIARLVEMLEP